MGYKRIRVQRLSPALGAEISGVDLGEPLIDDTVAEIRRAFLDHLVIFFHHQSLTPEQYLRFARTLGEPSEYPFVAGLDGYPEITEVIKKEDERINFGGIWHSDTTYLECPPIGTILYARVIPSTGGDTLFANMVMAYENLSAGMQRLLIGLTAVNSAEKDDAAATRDDMVAALRARGVASKPVLMAAHLEPTFKGHPHAALPVTEQIHRDGLVIPMFHGMSDEQLSTVVEEVVRVAGG